MRATIAAVVALALCGCANSPSSRKEHDASIYNTQLGIAYLNQGDLPLAKQKLDKAMAENPGDPNVHSAMAVLQERLGQPDKADKEYRAALRLSPHNPEIQNNYGIYLCRTGRTDEAVKIFEEAGGNPLYRTPEAAYTNAGVCLRSAKRNDQAALNFVKALRVRPNFSEAAFQLADLDFQLGEIKDARTELDRYLNTFEATPDLLLLAVRVARKQGDRLAADRFARKLRLDFPGSEQARALVELDSNPG